MTMVPTCILEAAEARGRTEVVAWGLEFCRNTEGYDPYVTTFADTMVRYYDIPVTPEAA